MHSEGQRLPRFFVLVFLDIQTGKPQGRVMKASQAMTPLGIFCSTPEAPTYPPQPQPRPLPHTTSGMAGAFLPAQALFSLLPMQ